jgi:cob(I)alamin adenosyltransferase
VKTTHRLTTITTRTGDGGQTRLGNNAAVRKDHPRVEALGALDELNSALGVVLTERLSRPIRTVLLAVQQDLFDLGGEICVPGHCALESEQVARLDAAIADFNAGLPPLREFVLPGGTRAAAAIHLARAICRRAERRLVTLGGTEWVSEDAVRYLNRLSDLLFVVARRLNRRARRAETQWRGTGARSNRAR